MFYICIAFNVALIAVMLGTGTVLGMVEAEVSEIVFFGVLAILAVKIVAWFLRRLES